jgi:hypothetical protein
MIPLAGTVELVEKMLGERTVSAAAQCGANAVIDNSQHNLQLHIAQVIDAILTTRQKVAYIYALFPVFQMKNLILDACGVVQ